MSPSNIAPALAQRKIGPHFNDLNNALISIFFSANKRSVAHHCLGREDSATPRPPATPLAEPTPQIHYVHTNGRFHDTFV